MKLTEKNLEAVLLNLSKTDRPITVKPTTWFGNPAKTAQWYTCPNCAKQSPLTLEWVGLTDEEVGDLSDFAYANDEEFVRNVEKYLKEKNNG
jgi:hypothetical protein